MRLNIAIKEIMRKEFPISDVSENLANCACKIGDKKSCIIIDKGNFMGILTPRRALYGFLNGIEKIKDLKLINEVGMVDSNEDVFYLVKIMDKGNLDYVLVKEKGEIIGFVTRKELQQVSSKIVNQLLIV